MKWLVVVVLAACGSSDSPDLRVTTSYAFSTSAGANPSPLDPLIGQTIAFEITWPTTELNHGDGSDPQGCATTGVIGATSRTASGSTATTVTTQILDRLDNWESTIQLCTTGRSSASVTAVIDALNFNITCFGLPALGHDSANYPVYTSFQATMCQAVLLDVVTNRTLGADGFAIQFSTP